VLPPRLAFNQRLVSQLSEADRAIGQLAGLGRSLPNPHLLAEALIRREAVLSSTIEGTQASLSDLVLFEADEARPMAMRGRSSTMSPPSSM
jgi:cell filamentation protein, protein adenylyltransferase